MSYLRYFTLFLSFAGLLVLSSSFPGCTQILPAAQEKGSLSTDSGVHYESYTPADIPPDTFPCGPFGHCLEPASAACPANTLPSKEPCVAASGKRGTCCQAPGACGAGGYCIPTSESQCREGYQREEETSCLPGSKQAGICCRLRENPGCQRADFGVLFSLSGSLVPSSLNRASLTLSLFQAIPSRFQQVPQITLAPKDWTLEKILFVDPKNPIQLQIQVTIPPPALQQTGTLALLAVVQLDSPQDQPPARCTIKRLFRLRYLFPFNRFDIQ